MKEKVIFIVGPTAVGKSETAIYLAKKLNAEIVSCDSMQIYKDMGIISSMPPPRLRRKAKHHLIGCINPEREYNVVKYRRQATGELCKIIKKGRVPLFVGGTGHYMSILIDGIFEGGSGNIKIRNRLYREAETSGSRSLHRKLQKIDPEAAGKIHPNDTKRVIRALEVFEATGKPISELQKERKGLSDKYDIKIFCLNMKRANLYKRIDARVEGMFKSGLIREVKRLLKYRLSKTASCAIGIRELKGFLDGAYDLDEAKRLVKRNTRQYAKRQLTWFRKDKRIRWIEVCEKERPADVAKRIWKELC